MKCRASSWGAEITEKRLFESWNPPNFGYPWVILKSHKAFGSFLGKGTHVWLEAHPYDGEKVTFSGTKVRSLLGVFENLKKDYHKQPTRGSVVIPAPTGIDCAEWADLVIQAGREVKDATHKELGFSGLFPWLPGYGNCCSVAQLIITKAGGEIPVFRPTGIAPGLRTSVYSSELEILKIRFFHFICEELSTSPTTPRNVCSRRS